MSKRLIYTVFLIASFLATGCDSCPCSKPGGGGRAQSYNCSTGRYTRELVTLTGALTLVGLIFARRRNSQFAAR